MGAFLLLVGAIAVIVFLVKQNNKAEEKAALDDEHDFEKKALDALKNEYGFGDRFDDKHVIWEWDNRYNLSVTILVDTIAKKLAIISKKKKDLMVIEGIDILGVDLKEETAAKHSHGDRYSSTDTYVKSGYIMIISKNYPTIDFCYHNNPHGVFNSSYSMDYGKALELKLAIESIAGLNKQPEVQVQSSSSSVSDELKNLNNLLKEGILTEEEFRKAKESLLAKLA